MPLTHPSENDQWPSWFYPPEVDEADPAAAGRIFSCAAEVPEGWAQNWHEHGANLSRDPPAPREILLTRAELRAELTKRDIAWGVTDAKAELQRLLDEAIEAEALDEGV